MRARSILVLQGVIALFGKLLLSDFGAFGGGVFAGFMALDAGWLLLILDNRKRGKDPWASNGLVFWLSILVVLWALEFSHFMAPGFWHWLLRL